jgi:hypothetical protein
MLRDARLAITRTIVAITDLSRVRPRKLLMLASLSPDEAFCLPHRNARRVSPDRGGRNVQIACPNRYSARADYSLRVFAGGRRGNRSRDTMGRQSAH